MPSESATFVRLLNVFQTSWTFGTRWVVVVRMSLVHWVGKYTGLKKRGRIFTLQILEHFSCL